VELTEDHITGGTPHKEMVNCAWDEREVPHPRARCRCFNVEPWVLESTLFCVMGMSGWWVINAIQWAESPIFVYFTPEKERIGNWLSVACAIGNVFPLVYKCFLSKEAQSKLLPAIILGCQVLAAATAVVCAMAWKVQAQFLGSGMHSIVLICCAIVSGGVGTLSNVTYWALSVRYPGTHCIKAMSVGMTVGGLVVASIALLQHAGKSPLFSVEVFMVGVAFVQGLFTFCFLFILRRPNSATDIDFDHGSFHNASVHDSEFGRSLVLSGKAACGENNISVVLSGVGNSGISLADASGSPRSSFMPGSSEWQMTKKMQVLILFIMFMVYALTYALPSLGPIMVMGYTNASSGPNNAELLRLMNVFQQLGDVLGRVATGLPYKPGVFAYGVMTASVFAISGVFIAAAMFANATPKLIVGGASYLFPILFFVYYFVRGGLVTVLYVHVKLSMKPEAAENFAGKMGLLGQIGSLLSNIALFFVINVMNVF